MRLKNKPLGIDITNHKDKDKRITFNQIDASTFFLKNQLKFDLILIKQTIHLFNFREIKKLLSLSKKNLTQDGKILIFTLETHKNELPTFRLMKTRLTKSLQRDKKIFNLITTLYPYKKSKFSYKVNITKKKYIKMIQKKYISILLPLTKEQIQIGVREINHKYKSNIKFSDKLICITL